MLLATAWQLSCGSQSRSSSSGGAGGRSATGGGGHDGLSRGAGGGGPGAAGGAPAGGGGGTGLSGGQSGHDGTGGTLGGGPKYDGSPLYTRVQRLTNDQWQRAVTDILRFDSPVAPLKAPANPPPPGTTAFTNNEKLLLVDAEAAVDFEAGAEAAAARATGSAEALARLYAGTDAAGFVRALGRRAFRRPLTALEEQHYQSIFAWGETLYGPGVANGAGLVIRAMLASPNFLYRSELGAEGEPLSGYEVAAKLSFWLLGTTPSDDLLDMAAAGELDTVAGVEAAARAMLERPEAAAVMRGFHGQLYHLDRYAGIDPTRAPDGLRAELADASSRFFDAIFTRGESVRSIFISTRFFVGPALAPLYGLDPPPAGIEERTFDATRDPSRVGYFTQAPFLLLYGASDGESDPLTRGFVLSYDVLCVPLPMHEDYRNAVPPLMPGQTNRARFEQVTTSCGTTCHAVFLNPLGYAFEGFDGLGRARDRDNGVAVDTKGSYPFATGTRTFADARALMTLIADSPDAQGCYAKGLAGYALQRDMVEGDRSLVSDLATVARDKSLKELIVALARNPAFRLRAVGGP